VTILGLDIGTTSCKAAHFDAQGDVLQSAAIPTPTVREGAAATHDPEELWSAVVQLLQRVTSAGRPEVLGIAGMAEAGLLVEHVTGKIRTPIIAWYDTRSTVQAEALAAREEAEEQFLRSGLHASYKYGLSKILWLREGDRELTRGAMWLSVPDYIAFRLTGAMATDPTLAARTYAYRIMEGRWDDAWIASLGLEASLFPPVLPSGTPIGGVSAPAAAETGLARGMPVAVAGHDHVCSMLAAGIVEPGQFLDSLGTAESVLAVAVDPSLGPDDLRTGLALVPHALPGRFCWLGGLSAAGGSIEWLRRVTGAESVSYQQLATELAQTEPGPTDVLYFPYLLGRGAPRPDRLARAAFIGIDMAHGRAVLLKAVIQGLAFEGETLRRAVERAAGRPATELIALGGGVRNRAWLQAKANVAGRGFVVPAVPEPAALGAAFAAGLGSGTLTGVSEVIASASRHRAAGFTIEPDTHWSDAYRSLYERSYLPFTAQLHAQARRRDAAETPGETHGR
jgi:sugar (pentulose or hexulose) kinase